MVIMASTERACDNFQSKVLSKISETLIIENFIRECKAKLVFPLQSPYLAKKLLNKHKTILTHRKLEAFLDTIDSNLENLDLYLLCEELLRQFEAASLDFSSLKVLLEMLSYVREGFALMSVGRILMMVLEYRFKQKKIVCKILSKLIKRLTNCTPTNTPGETIRIMSGKPIGKIIKASQLSETQELRFLSIIQEKRREIMNRDEFTRYSKNWPNSNFFKLRPFDILDKISTQECEPIFCDSDSIELEEIINEL